MDRKWGSNQWANNGFAIIEPVIMSSGQANAEIRTDGGAPVLTCLHEAPIVVHGTQDPGIRYDQAHTLGRNSGQENAICQFGDVAGTLTARHDSSPCADRGMNVLSVALRGREGGATAELGDNLAGCLRASSGGGDKPHALTQSAVRRLTPRECERLQGFPDGHTMIPWRNKAADDCADGPRYKAIGNSKAVPVVRWIGRRIEDYLNGLFDDDPLI